MKHRLTRLALLPTLALLSFAPAANAEVGVDYTLDLLSAYVWRGISVTDGLVFQPSVTTSHESGLSFNVWGNFDIDDVNDLEGEFNEIDLTLSYAFETDGAFGAEIGWIEYMFPTSLAPGTREVYVSIGWDLVIAPGIALYYDLDEVDDYYGELSLGWSTQVSETTSLDLGALVSFAGSDFSAAYVGGTDSGLFSGNVSAGFTWDSGGILGVQGFVAYTDSLDSDVLPDQPVDLYAAFGISLAF